VRHVSMIALIVIYSMAVAGGIKPAAGKRYAPRTVASFQIEPARGQQSEQELKARRDMAKRLNQDRQKKLKEDTDKLLQLATELKEYVDETNENILSVSVVRKTEEIEKLARSVREKMKTAYAAPDSGPPER
jgi:hypothetical protein